ncbi:non-ribosomal peptide synthetase [Streptomyces chattanoogensis]|uniref:Phenyloxazoline synthase MbtB n=1 Tax=Streptomyces chattanoogensis TaxID=66876 RepID=A0A0N0XUT1_9ACTN|nr:non-ribosomal peptide synthetase [Streptomyces chattanoogensis]KPC62704.1 pyochelin synthetase [Streptomyces chattanoogensis]
MSSDTAIVDLIAGLQRAGVQLWEEAGQLRYRAPRGVMNPERLESLRAHKSAVVEHLQAATATAALTPDPDTRHEPFPLTDVQSAYLLGRNDAFGFGGVACHVYLEVNYPDLAPERVEAAWNRLVERHDMLRAVISSDGHQRVLPNVPRLSVPATDLRDAGEERIQSELEAARDALGHRVYETTQWPLFDLRVTRTDERAVLHLSMDFLIADWASMWLLLAEFEALHDDPEHVLPPVDITFRDYLLAERKLRESARYQRDKDYWWARIDELPAAPDLPVIESQAETARFRRRFLKLDTAVWEELKRRAQQRGLTPSSVVMAAYAAAIERWSRTHRFSLNLTVLNRLPLHPHVNHVVGDFTSVNLLAVDWSAGGSFTERAAALSGQLFDDLDHRLCSGVEVLRELARRRGRAAALMPIVFTSAIGLGDPGTGQRAAGRLDGFGITQTPQVFIDCQAMDDTEGLQVNWDVRDGVFPEGVVDDMFDAFETLLRSLAAGGQAWDADAGEVVPLPAWQAEDRRRANDTAAPLPDTLLHQDVLAQAARTPDRPAVIGPHGTVSYGELAGRAGAVASALRDAGCATGDRVAVVMDKGVDQVSAVLGILLAGAVYLPVDTVQPPLRRAAILTDADVTQVLTQSWVDAEWPAGTRVTAVDRLAPLLPAAPPTGGDPDAPAYVIYTSGSTGRPKGVVTSHRAAGNTIADVNRRFGVTAADRILGLANLGFDLSVYDIFGPLAVGGALVLPEAERRTDPSHWAELIAAHGVTLWNSVPALMQMLSTYLGAEPTLALPTLRLALLSGDWIPVTLPEEIRGRIPDLEVISLGGATEASIWSIAHPYRGLLPGWRSIPYGRPLANQGFRVLDASLRDCPVWTSGELFITGDGLAQGYLGDQETTAYRFLTHPTDGQRLYRTGDFGRYLPGGEIEFLGRKDTQVKVRGHRIELGEIEAALLEHPAVAATGVVLDGEPGTERGLLGVVETAHTAEPVAVTADRLAPAVRTAADSAAQGLERDRVAAYVARLDEAVLTSMAHALRELGLFTEPGVTHTFDEVLAHHGIAPAHHWLVRRWLAVLTDAGFLHIDSAGRLGCRRPVDTDSVAQGWKGVEAAWSDELGSPGLLSYVRRNAELLPDLLTGKQDPVSLLFPEGRFDVADSLYHENAMARYLNRAVRTVLHRVAEEHRGDRPLRVLEAGAGTGGTTEGVLEALTDSGVVVDYLFTDVAPFFLPEARHRFGRYPWVRFGVFDVDTDHRAQGLTPNVYDVVLAAGVLENARDVEAALARLTELVAPGGWLVLTEPTREHPWILASQAFMMTEPGDAHRAAGASYLDRGRWHELLERAGAQQVLCLPDDDHSLAPQGVHLFAARLKIDRAAVTEDELARFLAERLPAHMIPSHLQVVDALPLTSNGKVDRRTLAGWRPTPVAAAERAETAEAPADELEARLAELWAAALATGDIGRSESFYDRGADSLIMARMAGQLREELPEAAEVPFDALLRQLLNQPMVEALARFLRSKAGPGPADADDALDLAGRRSDASNAVLIPFSTGGDGPLRVIFHAGLGTMDCFRPLAKELVAQDLGPVLGIVVEDTDLYCSLDPAEVIERAADDYAQRLVDEGHTRVQLIGYCLGGLYATEVARRLDERGVTVEDLILVSSHPVLFDVEDDLMIETLFLPNLRISLEQAGFGDIDGDALVRGFMQAIERNAGRVPVGSLGEVGGDPELDRAGDFFRKLGTLTREERFAAYARAASEATGQEMPTEMALGLFRVFRQSFLSARFTPEPYAGDIRFLLPRGASGFAPGMDDSTLAFWRDVCVGELAVTGIEGTHFSCIEEPNAPAVAEHIAALLRPAADRAC